MIRNFTLFFLLVATQCFATSGSNNYFNSASDLVAGTKARAVDINTRVDAIATGFDKLPAPHSNAPTEKGFNELFEILNGANAENPVAVQQIQKNSLTYAADTGTPNNYVVTLTPAITSYTAGLVVWFVPKYSNTGTSYLNVNGLGAKSIKYADDGDIGAGEIFSGGAACVMYDGSVFRLISAPARLTTRAETAADEAEAAVASINQFITSNTTFYVATTGNDTTGTGTSINPWYSLKKAFDFLKNKIISTDALVTISVGSGSYTGLEKVEIYHPNANRINILGSGDNYVTMNYTGHGIEIIGVSLDGISGIKFVGPGAISGYSGIKVVDNGHVFLTDVTVSSFQYGIRADGMSNIDSNAIFPVTVNNCSTGVSGDGRSNISLSDAVINLNSVTGSVGAIASEGSYISVQSGTISNTASYNLFAQTKGFIYAVGATFSTSSPTKTTSYTGTINYSVSGGVILGSP